MLPKYVENILARSQWKMPHYYHGVREGFYIFAIRKETDYTTARVFRREVDRFLAWAQREARRKYNCAWPIGKVLDAPKVTRHREQWAIVKIVDPIMHDIEGHIVKEVNSRYVFVDGYGIRKAVAK